MIQSAIQSKRETIEETQRDSYNLLAPLGDSMPARGSGYQSVGGREHAWRSEMAVKSSKTSRMPREERMSGVQERVEAKSESPTGLKRPIIRETGIQYTWSLAREELPRSANRPVNVCSYLSTGA